MSASVVLVGLSRSAKSCTATNGEVLACLIVFLWIQVRFSKDVYAAVSCPVPFNHLATKIGDIAKVKSIVILLKSGSLHWTGMQWRLEIRLFRWWVVGLEVLVEVS